LFSPVKSVGLIVVDESHEPAYKQEQAPHYQAVRVASQLARFHGATLILGSATPSVADYYIARQKQKPVLRMKLPAREIKNSEVTTEIIDLKNRDNFSRSGYLSDALIAAIKNSLSRGEQRLLYLNRRGTARVILCHNCGWQAVCPHCDLPLTYHHDIHNLQCHTCGFHQSVPTSCPECGNTEIVFKVVGTKAIEEEARKLFPDARVMRFDTDNKKAERFEQHYEAVRAGEVDILVGTQLLAKGLDLPKLTTLGVVIADTSLTFPDYSAEERTYQLLNQVIGRVGRGHSERERIIVQSYDPERQVIKSALASDYDSFVTGELAERQLFNFPPFTYVLKLSAKMASNKAAEAKVEQFMYSIQKLHLPLLIDGPIPSFHALVAGKYEWQLIVKSKQRNALLEVIAALPKSGWSYDIDPVNLL
jgi:primosomal protein N' (replication factor Y)